MLDQLVLNTLVHLKFFARNRLVMGLALIVVVVFALSLAPAFLMGSTIGRFDLLRMMVSQIGSITLLLTSGLGLFAIAAHVRGRNLKLVFTRPCPPEVWLASVFLAGGLVIGGLHLLIAAGTWALSAALGVPYQSGFAFLALDGFFRSMVWFSYVTALSIVFHPVLAVLLALFLNEGTFYALKFALASAASTGAARSGLATVGRALVDVFYYLLPITHPFSDRTAAVYSSMRVVRADWSVLLQVAGYASLATLFFFCVSDLLLRRKSLA